MFVLKFKENILGIENWLISFDLLNGFDVILVIFTELCVCISIFRRHQPRVLYARYGTIKQDIIIKFMA